MSEYKRKFGVYAAWNYELEIEELNEMSAKGWQLINGGLFSSRFKKNSNLQYRYQLDFQPHIEDKGRYIETFREQGWEYVNSTFNGWHYFRKLYDESKPQEEYEIFTDTVSIKEMNNRWATIGMVCSVILLVYLAIYLLMLIALPKFSTLFGIIYLGGILAVILRGVLTMKKQGASRKSKFDKALMRGLVIWTVTGGIVNFALIEARPYCCWRKISEEYAPISADLKDATNWLPVQVQYPDNYYMDLKINASTPLCVSFADAERNVIYSVKSADFTEDNIRFWLDKGEYSIYLSDFEGGSIDVEMSLE